MSVNSFAARLRVDDLSNLITSLFVVLIEERHLA